jgi:predicted DNA binding protein
LYRLRELVFEIRYEPGANRVGNTLAEYPDARIRSLSLHATTESDDISPERKAALQAAVDHGYYESPGEIDVKGLADRLDVPQSTLNHRLRRGEDPLAKQRVARMHSRRRPPFRLIDR